MSKTLDISVSYIFNKLSASPIHHSIRQLLRQLIRETLAFPKYALNFNIMFSTNKSLSFSEERLTQSPD